MDLELQKLFNKLSRNDPSTKVVYGEWTPGYGVALGEALRDNTVVAALVLQSDLLLPRDATTTSDLTPLLKFISRSSTLQKLELNDTRSRSPHSLVNAIWTELLEAVGTNAHVTECIVRSPNHIVPMDSIAHCLQATRSLRKFTLWVPHHSDLENVALVASVRSNTSLHQLLLLGGTVCLNSYLGHSVASYSNLTRLQLDCHLGPRLITDPTTATPCTGLVQVIQRTTTLQELHLRGYQMDAASTEPLVHALRMNSTLVKLHWGVKDLDAEATTLFQTFVQNDCHRGSNKIRELYVEPKGFFADNKVRVLVDMVLRSNLSSLSIGQVRHGRGVDIVTGTFLSDLTQNITKVRLSTLQLPYMTDSDVVALCQFVRLSTSLHHLTYDMERPHGAGTFGARPNGEPMLVSALRQNGSLRTVTVQGSSRTDVYLERNEGIPRLLSQRPSDDPMLVSEDGYTSVRLFPSLFAGGQPASGMAPSWILSGLLKCADNEFIGPSPNAKLKRP